MAAERSLNTEPSNNCCAEVTFFISFLGVVLINVVMIQLNVSVFNL